MDGSSQTDVEVAASESEIESELLTFCTELNSISFEEESSENRLQWWRRSNKIRLHEINMHYSKAA